MVRTFAFSFPDFHPSIHVLYINLRDGLNMDVRIKFEEKAKQWVQNWRIRIASRLVSTTATTTPTAMTTTAATPAVTTGETGATAATPAVTTGKCVVDHTDTSGEHTKREV